MNQNAAAANGLRPIQHDGLVEADPAFLHLPEKLVDNRQLDARGRRERLVFEVSDAIARCQIDDLVPDDAVDAARNLRQVSGKLVLEFLDGKLLARRLG